MGNNIKEWWLGPHVSEYTKPVTLLWFLQAQIRWRWNNKIADRFVDTDVDTFTRWHFRNRKVKLGEIPLRAIILVPPINEGTATTIRIPNIVLVYHILQTAQRQ